MFLQFIQPCSPVLVNTVPAGDEWQHEIKFDGFRVQIHKLGNEVELFSRNGSRFSRRFARLVSVLRELPAKPTIMAGPPEAREPWVHVPGDILLPSWVGHTLIDKEEWLLLEAGTRARRGAARRTGKERGGSASPSSLEPRAWLSA